MMSTDPNSPHVVASHLTELEASLLIDGLQEHGIEAHAWGANTAALQGEAGPLQSVSIVVRQADVEKANSLLAELRRG